MDFLTERDWCRSIPSGVVMSDIEAVEEQDDPERDGADNEDESQDTARVR